MTDHDQITLGWVPKKSGDPIPSRADAKCKCNRYPGCTRHKAQCTRGQSTAKLIWKRVWSQAVRQVGVGSRVTPSYQSGTLTLPPPQTWSGCHSSCCTRDQREITTTAQQRKCKIPPFPECITVPQTNFSAASEDRSLSYERFLFWFLFSETSISLTPRLVRKALQPCKSATSKWSCSYSESISCRNNFHHESNPNFVLILTIILWCIVIYSLASRV